MCENSMYVEHRTARSQEELTTKQVPGYGSIGFYSRDTSGPLVCTLNGTKMFVQELILHKHVAPHIREAWYGKKNVEVTYIDHTAASRFNLGADAIKLPDGTFVYMNHIKPGTNFNIGKPFERDLEKDLRLNNPDVDITLEEQGTLKPRSIIERVVRRVRGERDSVEGDD